MKEHTGRFYLFGGGARIRSSGQPFLQDFIRQAGGTGIRLTILTAASQEAAEINAIYWDLFTELGVTQLLSPIIGSREEADDESIAQLVADSDAIFIAGGSQYKLISRLAGTAIEGAIRSIRDKGGLLGGTSSGASLFGHPLILDGGTSDSHLRKDMIEFTGGLNMLGGDTAVDTHCSSRGRFPRILSLLIEHPWVQAIGMDEDTGLFVNHEGVAQVSGYNSVYIFDGTSSTTDPAHFCASGIQIHCLHEGDSYDLLVRRKTNH